MALFSFGKKCHSMQKMLVFVVYHWSTVIKSCCANFGGKVTSVFVYNNSGRKKVNFGKKEIDK